MQGTPEESMSGSPEILTCAGCGRPFKASLENKSYKCASCQDIISASQDNSRLHAGKVVCGECWAAVELREQLSRASENLFGGNGSAATYQPQLNEQVHALETTIGELEARLALAVDNCDAAVREREIAAEARGKVEKTLSEFLGKFASARQGEMTAARERDSAAESVRSLRQQLSELEIQLKLSQETERDAFAERNTFAEQNADLKAHVEELEMRLANIQSAAAQHATARMSSSRMQAVLDGKLSDVQVRLNAVTDELARFKQQAQAECDRLKSKVGDLHGDLVAAQVDRVELTAEKELLEAKNQEAAAKLADVTQRYTKIQEAHQKAIAECESALASFKREQDESRRLNAEMAKLRNAVVQALEPLAEDVAAEMTRLHQLLAADAAAAQHVAAARSAIVGRVQSVLGGPRTPTQHAMPSAAAGE
jgi:chromosome segregation ATPase